MNNFTRFCDDPEIACCKAEKDRTIHEEQVESDLWLISEFCYGNFGKTVFLTRKEAEAVLMQNCGFRPGCD
jgi:hypothetical protein